MIGKGLVRMRSHRSAVLAAVLVSVSACSTVPRERPEPPAPVAIVAPAPVADFTIAAGMLDTWNAVGQILVRTDGATYEGRAQMLGLYEVLYRGERFLILTRAQVLSGKDQVATTKVAAVRQDGKPDLSDAAIALLAVLQSRLPEELSLDASGARGKKHCYGKKTDACK